MTADLTAVRTPDGEMPAHLWRPPSGTGPGILLLQEIFGISDYIVRRAEDLAALGYVVLAPEIYWRIGESRVENGPDALEEAFGLVQRIDWEAAVARRRRRALAHLRELPEVDRRRRHRRVLLRRGAGVQRGGGVGPRRARQLLRLLDPGAARARAPT